MRLVAFALPDDDRPRVGVLAHDGARVVDLSEIGVSSLADAASRAPQLARLASHLLHAPGALAHPAASTRLGAPAERLAAVYDAAGGGRLAVAIPPARGGAPVGPAASGATLAVAAEWELGAGIACVIGRTARGVTLGDVDAHAAGLALVLCWRAADGVVRAAALGPWLATLDALDARRSGPLAYALDAAVAVNGEPRRGGSWAALTAKLAPAVVDASRRAPCAPGDAVAVVTFALARENGAAPAAAPADEAVALEAEFLGTLRVTASRARDAGRERVGAG